MQAAPVFASVQDCSDYNSVSKVNLENHDHTGGGLPGPCRINVLVIEDSDFDFRTIREALQHMASFRANVHRASDILSARQAFVEQDFDIVLVEFGTGFETAAHTIQTLGGCASSTALIPLTGMPEQNIRQIALNTGAAHCLAKKQLNPVLLETAIRSALHAQSLELQLQDTIIELELANRAKTDFFARIGHDLKTPLNGILGYAQMIAQQTFGDGANDKYAACAENVCTAGTHLVEILDNLIHHAASQGTSSGGHFESADLNDLAKRAVDMAVSLARHRNHDIEFVPCKTGAPMVCHPPVMTQAILNLVSNAVKYTPSGGRICITVSLGTRYCEVRVEDNGLGMSQEDIDIAMQPFGRVELPSQHAQDGTGIGLPIVRDIVSSHAGNLEIESSPGSGTIVTMRMPRPQLDKTAA